MDTSYIFKVQASSHVDDDIEDLEHGNFNLDWVLCRYCMAPFRNRNLLHDHRRKTHVDVMKQRRVKMNQMDACQQTTFASVNLTCNETIPVITSVYSLAPPILMTETHLHPDVSPPQSTLLSSSPLTEATKNVKEVKNNKCCFSQNLKLDSELQPQNFNMDKVGDESEKQEEDHLSVSCSECLEAQNYEDTRVSDPTFYLYSESEDEECDEFSVLSKPDFDTCGTSIFEYSEGDEYADMFWA